MEHEIFEEVEHWLAFINIWESENEGVVPEDVILALDYAFQKAIGVYKEHYVLKDLENILKHSLQ